jgi:hypothetical protein
MNGADFDAAIFDELGESQTLRTGEREIDLPRDSSFEEVDVFGPPEDRKHEVHVVHALRIDGSQISREKIGLFLVIAFKAHAVAGPDKPLEHLDDALAVEDLPRQRKGDRSEALGFAGGTGVPSAFEREHGHHRNRRV